MNEFMMIFRYTPSGDFEMTPEQIGESIQQWQGWIGTIAAEGKFVSTNQLGYDGKTLMANKVVTDGPYAEIKEIIGGYVICKAENIDDAIRLAHGCPVLEMGGHVEVREITPIN